MENPYFDLDVLVVVLDKLNAPNKPELTAKEKEFLKSFIAQSRKQAEAALREKPQT